MQEKPRLPPADVAVARERRRSAVRLQEVEGNPLRADELAMFEMFEREAWPHARRRAFILGLARKLAAE